MLLHLSLSPSRAMPKYQLIGAESVDYAASCKYEEIWGPRHRVLVALSSYIIYMQSESISGRPDIRSTPVESWKPLTSNELHEIPRIGGYK